MISILMIIVLILSLSDCLARLAMLRERGSAPKRGGRSAIVFSTECIRAVAAWWFDSPHRCGRCRVTSSAPRAPRSTRGSRDDRGFFYAGAPPLKKGKAPPQPNLKPPICKGGFYPTMIRDVVFRSRTRLASRLLCLLWLGAVIHVRMTIKQTLTVLMSHSQFRRIKAYTETCMA